ncbi:nuclear nucleic acid-binding protein C1D-like isoform X2 [Colletes gigas]|nr:nuclear nucleic acid-binding protein C1D-like isoform X2 [Colletes gigas]XP_043263899.1 nuclear nucleic acid-binding protein C1D-like isoform X2 [Colletes gigas]XP_043263900.1 nuclear nucleic acid-binding protein C1D-like isoform X2 [Colletes gigas]XP_043263901.1 nuclear nucleic acid-binding protein C1D-like isoform X2 [Colletes gigas]XP_043263902.1 nuclear nucleic acid-binding protein C1D-like isoform X2 [Colletes gigas]XP_043263903.1 nuclear nucleic acid-binding protein C1D-like isoform X
MNTNFEELSHDKDLIAKLEQYRDGILKIEEMIKLATDPDIYEKLTNADKIKYNLLMSYSANSMFWMYLRAEGIDPTKHKIRLENERLKKSMTRAKQIEERITLMPRINKDAAQRFVRNGLWEMKNNK